MFGAVLVLLAVVGALLSGCVETPFGAPYAGSVIVLVLGSDAEGATVPAVVVVIETGNGVEARAVDPRTEVTVPGTSYGALRDAYPFSGGSGVAEALAASEGGEPLPYVVLTDDQAVELMGSRGIELTLGSGISAYRDGTLFRLLAGTHAFAGAELGALLASVDYLAPEDRAAVENGLAQAVSGALATDPSALADAVEVDSSATDLSPSGLSAAVAAIGRGNGQTAFTGYR
jgi:hypothetical protein